MDYELNASAETLVINASVKQEFKHRLDEHGFVISRNFLSAALLDQLRQGPKELASACMDAIGMQAPVQAVPMDTLFCDILRSRPDLSSVIYDRLQQSPGLLALANDPFIKQFASEILQTDSVGVWPRMQIRLDRYESTHELISWHHDYVYNLGTQDSFTFWIPLDDVSVDMGTMDIVPGSHKHDFDFIITSDDRRHNYTLPEAVTRQFEVFQPKQVNAGDAVIMHSRLIHCGKHNTNRDRARLVCLFRMQNLRTLEDFTNQQGQVA